MKNDISAIGNALVDTVFKVPHELIQELGLEIDQMNLSNAEEQAPIIKRLVESGAETISDCGGSATNSLVAAASYGAKCFHVCKVTDDVDGATYLNSLKDAGVAHNGNMADSAAIPTGKCLILVTPDAKRSMMTSLSISSKMTTADLDLENIANSKIFYIEGYMVTSNENYKCALAILEHLKSYPEVKIALSLSDPGIVAGFRDQFKEIESYGLSYIFGNDDEAMAFTGAANIEQALLDLQSKSFTSIITMGAHGSAVVTSSEIIKVDAVNINPIDTNGAGDMFAGSFLYALLQNKDLTACAEFANYGAARVVETFGPRLSKEGYVETLKSFQKN